MSDTVRFRCNNCGRRFEAEVLTEDEKRKAAQERRPTSAVQCPDCNRTDIRRGWE
jgi:DNA-directed RNA polymerase subunit RPC12/RpoP